jgi:hypothetical protein
MTSNVENYRTYADAKIASMRVKRMATWLHMRELARFILPRRYHWLIIANDMHRGSPINNNIVDSTGTLAARTLANGMMSGITSPTRPWLKFRIQGMEDDQEVAAWLAECVKRMLIVFAESNFYTAMAVMYFDLVVFGTSPVIIYEDFENVINCFNPCAGEYFIDLDDRFRVNQFAREFVMTYDQITAMFGLDNVTADVKQSTDTKSSPAQAGGSGPRERIIYHLMEPNKGGFDLVPSMFPFREVYWEQGGQRDKILRAKGFHEWPTPTPRWDVNGNDPYGRSPGMDALGDIKQLQQETMRKGQAIDKMVNPPMVADIQLKNQPASTVPNGWTYVSGLDNTRPGARPLYQVNPQIRDMMEDIREIQQRIKIIFNNDLFTGITDLQTVRTATEIDARREEKLVLLGPVLERIINEGLSQIVDRVWGIMERGRLLPPPPQQLRTMPTHIQVDYVSMLTIAQRGIATAGIEKLWGFAGGIAGAKPEVLDRLDEDETIKEYASDLSVSPKLLKSDKAVEALQAARAKQAQMQQAAQVSMAAVEGAKTLSETDVGGGKNALAAILGSENVPGATGNA